jgi:hypothetical protein
MATEVQPRRTTSVRYVNLPVLNPEPSTLNLKPETLNPKP